MEYHVTAGEILYTVIQNDLPSICGVIDVFDGKDAQAIQEEFPNIETEMYLSGIGSVDFDGVFTVDEAFAGALAKCARCSRILAIPVRRDRIQRQLTIFFCEDGNLALEQTEKQSYLLHTQCDPERIAADFLQLPEHTSFSESCCIDSGLIQRKDLVNIISGGCDTDLAELAVQAAKGIAGLAQLIWITGGTANELTVILYNENGIVTVDVEYTWEQENMRLTPVSAQWVLDCIHGHNAD